jgi:hypothetical protein
VESEKIYMTQAELAKRWHCSEGTIINYRKKGFLPYFRLPGCSKILYKIYDVEQIEQQYSKRKGDDNHEHKQVTRQIQGKPVISANKEWRI